MSQDDAKPTLHVDTDWKAQAQAEKERLAQQESAKERPGKLRDLPDADFRTLVGVFASQAIMGLGAMGDPKTGRVVVDLDGSRFAIDLLDVLEQKTRGNLTEEEATELRQVLAELRNRYVQITNLVAQQALQAPQVAGAGAVPIGAPKQPLKPQ